MSHTNSLPLTAAYIDTQFFYGVAPRIRNTCLLSDFVNQKLPEAKVAQLVRQILVLLQTLGQLGIVLRTLTIFDLVVVGGEHVLLVDY